MSQAGNISIGAFPTVPTTFTTDDGNSATPAINILLVEGDTVANGTYTEPVWTTSSGNIVKANIQIASAIGSAPTDMFNAGLCSFDNTAFSITANGYVTLAGGAGPAIDSIQVDGFVGPGTNPVVPDGNGLIGVEGATISAHDLPVQTFSRAANAYRFEVQLASAVDAPAALQSGLSHYDSDNFSVDTNGFVTLKASSFTKGSVIFWGDSSFAEDNSNFFWDSTNNFLGIGTPTPTHELEVFGTIALTHTATTDENHALELTVDADGVGNIEALDINYTTGAISAGEEEAVILINIDETSATGGEIFGIEVLSTTEGGGTAGALKSGIGVDAIHQEAGTFGNIDDVLNIAVDVTAAVASGGAGNVSMFVADDDTITLGDAAKWDQTEVIIDTAASGAGIAPVFAFSTGGAGFTTFTPVDGTNGFKNTGIIAWEESDLAGWATNASGRFEIRITRTRNVLTTTPIVDTLQLGATTEFIWDAEGNVNLNGLSLVVPLTAPNGGRIGWVEETTTSRALVVNQGVVGANAGTITMTLPATAAQFTIFRFVQKGAGVVKLAQNAGQTIHFGNQDSTTGAGGFIESTAQWDSVELICTTANTDFAVLSSIGNWAIT